jgi:hypothetical protein
MSDKLRAAMEELKYERDRAKEIEEVLRKE